MKSIILVLVALSFCVTQDSMRITGITKGNGDTVFVNASYYWHFTGGGYISGSCYAYVDRMTFWYADTLRNSFRPIAYLSGKNSSMAVDAKMRTLSRPLAIADSGKYKTTARWTIDCRVVKALDSGWTITIGDDKIVDVYWDSAHTIDCRAQMDNAIISSTYSYGTRQTVVYPFKRLSSIESPPFLCGKKNLGNFYYDVRGRRLASAPTRSGIYLYRGNRVVIMR